MRCMVKINDIEIPVYMTNEESDFLCKIESTIDEASLTERDKVIANNLVRKSVLGRHTENNTIKYIKNPNEQKQQD